MDNLNIFLLFPQTDDDILAFDEEKLYKDIPEQLFYISKVLKQYQVSYRLLYDSKDIASFCDKAEEICSGEYLGKIRNQILNLLGRGAVDLNGKRCYKTDCCYNKWVDSSVELVENTIFRSATEYFIENKDEKTVIVSLLNKDVWHRDIMPIIKDAKHYDNLPILCNIPYFNPANTFIEWCNTNISNHSFSLLNVSVFERTNKIYPISKRRIYLEKQTGRYWYYDYFHKDNKEHYEVFDKNGKHVGEADRNGNVDESKYDKGKTIKNFI